MLEVAPSAFSKVGTGRGYALRGGFHYAYGLGAEIMSPIFTLLNKNPISRYGERDEGGTSLIKGQATTPWNDPLDINREWGFQFEPKSALPAFCQRNQWQTELRS
ncbi:MAG: hypothetical protein DMG06_06175 [Acidobacteria bacterium]|nr:MAG: hypothetical protein DMG06_06175 [Acidobacteriota bacterium]